MNKSTLKKYAKAVVEIGINLKKGQDVIIYSSTEHTEFVKNIVEVCYKKGARVVSVEWSNSDINKLSYTHMSEETLSELPTWAIEKQKYRAEKLPCMIHISSEDPDAMKDIDMDKVIRARMKQYPILKPIYDSTDSKYQWVIVAMPSIPWAKKVFPDLPAKVAYKKLEEAILYTSRITTGKNPIAEWKKHISVLEEKADILNSYNFDKLHYVSSNGTDLTIKLMPNHFWISAREKTMNKKIAFTANMPTEEVFTMPSYDGVNGVVYSSKPLSLHGQLVEDFKVTFKDGKAVDVKARVGQEALERMLSMDEKSKHLGEVALVPYDSPINLSNILFYNTLFDENAACHLAFGMAFKNNVRGYEKMTDEDFKKINYNDSVNHVDFMIGTSDLSIVGTTFDGKEIEIFKNGNWAL